MAFLAPLRAASETANRAKYDFLRYLLTLATGALALLVSLQGSYRPTGTLAIWLLRLSWGTLAAAILCGGFAAAGDVWIAVALRKHEAAEIERTLDGLSPTAAAIYLLPWRYRRAEQAFFWLLSASVLLLTAFAIVNV